MRHINFFASNHEAVNVYHRGGRLLRPIYTSRRRSQTWRSCRCRHSAGRSTLEYGSGAGSPEPASWSQTMINAMSAQPDPRQVRKNVRNLFFRSMICNTERPCPLRAHDLVRLVFRKRERYLDTRIPLGRCSLHVAASLCPVRAHVLDVNRS